MNYAATKEQHRHLRSGSFQCDVCRTVHEWSGHYDLFDWKIDKMKAPVFGKRWSARTKPDNASEPDVAEPDVAI
jgi:hypothetical protein